MNKKLLINKIISFLQQELSTLQTAANNAHLAAIDDQSVAETQYDTLAIEAGYLAEGQSRRVLELKLALQQTNAFTPEEFNSSSEIACGALIQLEKNIEHKRWYFIAPAAAGFKTTLNNNGELEQITVITEKSPLGQALIGLYQDDEVSFNHGNNAGVDVIANVC